MLGDRFEPVFQGAPYPSEYDIRTPEIADIQNRGVGPVRIVTNIDLSSAGSLSVNEVGYGFACYVQNATSGAILPEALLNVYVNTKDASDSSRAFPTKCGRGYHGAFQHLYLTWPAQTAGTVSFVIFKSRQYPWTGGEEAT